MKYSLPEIKSCPNNKCNSDLVKLSIDYERDRIKIKCEKCFIMFSMCTDTQDVKNIIEISELLISCWNAIPRGER